MYKSWTVVLFEVTMVWVSDLYSQYILCNFFFSLWLFCFDWTLTGLKWILELKLIFWPRHNLEGKYDNIYYNQWGFYWCKTEFQIIKTDNCHVKSGHVRATIVVTTNCVSVFSQKYLGNISSA